MNQTFLRFAVLVLCFVIQPHSFAQYAPGATRIATRQAPEHGSPPDTDPAVAAVNRSPLLTPTITAAPTVPAFPGAEGFGAGAVGGRGGAVIEVTNLNDSGPGSLRAAAEASGPRTVVFRTGGTIVLQSKIKIDNPYITIAGQTAPGGGIAIATDPSYTGPAFTIEASDVIFRYLRIRPGPSQTLTNGVDAITILSGSNIILDHCSLSWATDEVLSTSNSPRNITVQWSIISEGLQDSTHIEGPHSKGALLGETADNISFHHNLMAHNFNRNPQVNSYQVADVVNNVIYNWGQEAVNIQGDHRPIWINVIGNYALPGADTIGEWMVNHRGPGAAELYVQGNIGPTRPTDDRPEEDVVDDDDRIFIVPTAHPAAAVTTSSAFDAYTQVLSRAGATIPARDPVDERVVNDVINRTGRVIDDPSQVGGWPTLSSGTPPTDTDHDGMPDWWEQSNGLDPDNPADGPMDPNLDGYSNLEHYVNSLAQHAPQVYAGPDLTVTLPAAAVLNGSAFDDGLPNPPGALAITWSAVSEPGIVAFGDPSVVTTTAEFSQPGVYVLRLSANDGETEATDEVSVTVVLNQAPNVNSGPDLTVVFPASAALDGSVTDDGAPNPPGAVTTQWTVVSGPGTVTFGDPAKVDTFATFSAAGTYVLRLTADDGDMSIYDEVRVNVVTSSQLLTDEVRVSAGSDDAEESASGNMSLTSSDLELVFDNNNQTVGMRFAGLDVPQGAGIVSAYIQFQADETNAESTSLTIQGQAADNAVTFTSSANDISSRTRTNAAVNWEPAPWTQTGQAGAGERTPDISAVIQEIVNRPGWSAGQALAIIISGAGKRVAESFDGDSAAAPLLHVEYSTGGPAPSTADLSVEIGDSADPVSLGSEFIYTVTVRNRGPSEATGVTVNNSLPPQVSLISTVGCTESPGVPLCTLGTIAAGAERSYSVNVEAAISGDLIGQATVMGNEPDPDLANNTATEGTVVNMENQPPDVDITAPFSGATFTEGDSISFTASANDPEQGNLTASIVWVSSIDGQIGSGGSLSTAVLSPGPHTVTATASDSAGLSGNDSVSITVIPNSGILLTVEGYKSKGLQKASLSWTGAASSMVDIHRNGSMVATTPNDGFFTDDIDVRGRGSYRFRICETGGTACSAEVPLDF